MPTNTNRFESIDICRGIGIIIVLYMHGLQIAFEGLSGLKETNYAVQMQILSSFIMALFFFISGLVSHHRAWQKTIFTSLYLFVIAISVQIIGWLFVSLANINKNLSILEIMENLFRPLLILADFKIPVLWFFVSLAFIKIAYEGIIRANLVWRIVIILSIIGLYLVNRVTGKLYFEIGAILPGLIFYAIGQFLGKSMIGKIESNATILKLIVFITALIMLAFLNHGGLAPLDHGGLVNPFDNDPDFWVNFEIKIDSGNVGFFPLFIANGLLGSFAAVYLSVIIFRNSKTVSSFLSKVGRHTIELLIINGIFISTIPRELSEIIGIKNDGFSPIILVVILTLIQIVLLPLWIKIVSPLLTMCKAMSNNIIVKVANFI